MRLRKLSFSLPEEAGLKDINQFKDRTTKLKKLLKGVGKSSNEFEKSLRELAALARCRDVDKFCDRINSGKDIRAVIHLWLTDSRVYDMMPVSKQILYQFRKIRPSLSLMALYELIELFMVRFDRIESAQLSYLSKFLIGEFGKTRGRVLIRELESLREHSRWLLSTQGPIKVAEYAAKNKLDFDVAVARLGVPQEIGGRYIELARNHYYIKTIDALDPVADEKHPILTEVVSESVKESKYQEDLWLGHAVVRSIIANVIKHNVHISQNWLQVILSIAGDPRVSARSVRFSRWWARIGEPYISHMRGWLSRFDFRLFLEVLSDYAESSNNFELKKMFPPREKFLEGLYELDLIENTRLFLSTNADRYLRSNYNIEELPSYAKVQDPNISVIYLRVGGMHIVEGTHSFSIRIYDRLPKDNSLIDYEVQSLKTKTLRTRIAEKYIDQFGATNVMPAKITHHPNLAWQHKVIECLAEFGVDVNPEEVLTRSDYRQYRRKYGIRTSY